MFALTLLLTGTNAHGRLTVPATRNPVGYEHDPVSGNTGDDFVCRNGLTSSLTTITAGQKLALQWDFQADHVGDCAVFISYDYTSSNSDMKFFKIANLPRCRETNNQNVEIDLPDWLPGGQAILRWDWYALHVFPTVEFYAQCVDVTITPTGNAVTASSIVKYSITSPAVYPANANSGVGFRNPYNTAQGMLEQYMTGPNCAGGYSGNDCSLTAKGTTGFVDVGDDSTTLTSGGGGGSTGPSSPSGEGSASSPIAIVVLVACLLLALAAGVFLWKLQRANKEAQAMSNNMYPTTSAAATSEAPALPVRAPPPPPARVIKANASWRV